MKIIKHLVTIFLLLVSISNAAAIVSYTDELRQKAQSGDRSAMFHLGVHYDKGTGVPQDYKQAHNVV